jgi:hypothetical protein
MDRGRAMLRRTLPEVGGVTLLATRITQDRRKYTCTISTAVIGSKRDVSNATTGPRIETGERDYLIPPADYKLGPTGEAVEPMEGDKFRSVEGGETLTFKVTPVPGEPAWRYTDGGRTMLRVHVKQVTNEEGR